MYEVARKFGTHILYQYLELTLPVKIWEDIGRCASSGAVYDIHPSFSVFNFNLFTSWHFFKWLTMNVVLMFYTFAKINKWIKIVKN